MKTIIVIPARYGSTRFHAKVLAKDTGKYLIQHTWEKACQAKIPTSVIIAADDQRIIEAAQTFNARAVLTSTDHQSGTDRIAQAAADLDADIIINLQADEPEIDPENIDRLAQLLIDNPDCPMATLSTAITAPEQVADPNIVKVITDTRSRAIYFSRSVIPFDRDAGGIGFLEQYSRHLGIYAYKKDFLLKLTRLEQTKLEKIEKLEQLRVLENGFSILVGRVKHHCDGIDTAEQYKKFVERQK